jgi:hypothetical protein
MKDKRFLGSNIAIILGIFTLIAGISQVSSTSVAGINLLIGAAIYQSAKKRKLGLVVSNKKSLLFEIFGLSMLFVLLLSTNKVYLVEDPVPHLLIPVAAVISYCFIICRKNKII